MLEKAYMAMKEFLKVTRKSSEGKEKSSKKASVFLENT